MTALPSHGERMPAAATDAVACAGVTVDFGDFRALDDVSLAWRAGTVNVVVGQNGAGKTTLARVLAGLQHPSRGTVMLEGEPLATGDVMDARRRGVELVHQHFALPASFTVSQALELFNANPRRLGFFTRKELAARAQTDLEATNLDVSPHARVGDLPVETLQALEITRALASRPSVLVLDEPTAVLSPPAVAALFGRIRQLAQAGICVVLVLHKLDEVMEIAETVAVLRGGQLVLEPTMTGELDRRALSRLVVGGRVVEAAARPASSVGPDHVLRLRGVSAATAAHDARIAGVDLSVRSGEIVGVAGVEGNGQRSLVEAIAGIATATEGSVVLDGADITRRSVRARRAAGVRIVPFERNTEGISRSSSLWENHALLAAPGESRTLRPGARRRACREALDKWDVRFRSVDQPAGELSGGNAQKTILARELGGEVRCLIAAHPTRGLDIAATESVRTAITNVATAGAGVLLVSADLDELFQLSHRLVVLCRGRIAADLTPPFNLEAVGWAMTGGEPA